MPIIEDPKRKLTREKAVEKLSEVLSCGHMGKFYTCFNIHHFQGSYSQGRGYTDRNGYWACTANLIHGCLDKRKLYFPELKKLLKVNPNALKRKDLINFAWDCKQIIEHFIKEKEDEKDANDKKT